MSGRPPMRIDRRIHLIDGFDLGVPERTGTYVIDEAALTLVETGPSPSVKHVKDGLAALGFALEEVKYIIVTHVHLDHAGGAGLLLQDCPNAQVIVHPRGRRHLADPSKLTEGARAIYGESFSDLFDPVVPIPEDRLVEKTEGDTLQVSDTCTLQFLDTPGHAKHHFSIYDPRSNGLFAGDTVGVRYEPLITDGIDLFLPTTSPNHFDPEDMQASIARIRNLGLDRIYFGHFGMTEKVTKALDAVDSWIDIFIEEGEQAMLEGKQYDDLSRRLYSRIRDHLRSLHVDDNRDVYTLVNLDTKVSAMGIIDYFRKVKQ